MLLLTFHMHTRESPTGTIAGVRSMFNYGLVAQFGTCTGR